jgi:hypothetical protein
MTDTRKLSDRCQQKEKKTKKKKLHLNGKLLSKLFMEDSSVHLVRNRTEQLREMRECRPPIYYWRCAALSLLLFEL